MNTPDHRIRESQVNFILRALTRYETVMLESEVSPAIAKDYLDMLDDLAALRDAQAREASQAHRQEAREA